VENKIFAKYFLFLHLKDDDITNWDVIGMYNGMQHPITEMGCHVIL